MHDVLIHWFTNAAMYGDQLLRIMQEMQDKMRSGRRPVLDEMQEGGVVQVAGEGRKRLSGAGSKTGENKCGTAWKKNLTWCVCTYTLVPNHPHPD
jgi:hypothetical protein